MKFLVLGPLAVQGPAGSLELGGPRQRSVLARLLVAGGEVVPVDRLLEDLWNGEPPPRAVASLQASVANLRRALEPDRAPRSAARRLVSAPPGYSLGSVDQDEVDAAAFELAVSAGSRLLAQGRPTDARHTLDAALGLWRGPAYADFADEPWAAAEVARLEELRQVAHELRTAAALAADLGSAGSRRPQITVPAQREPSPLPVAGNDPIGRAAPLSALLAAAGEALAGRIAVAVISGDSGIGKSVLAEALSDRLRAGGWRVAWGRCPHAQGVPALWPWQQALAPLVNASPPGPEIVERLAGLLGTDAPPHVGATRAVDGAEARFRQHEAVARYLANASAKEPVLVVLDDLQWADAASLRLLLDVIALRRGGRLMIVATVRPGERGPLLEDALGRLSHDGALRITLDGLETQAIGELVASLGLELDDAQVAQLAARTAGNPLLLTESVKLAASEGTEALLAGPPPTVRDVLRRRLVRLPAKTRDLLAAAAVLGLDVDPDLLCAVLFEPDEQVLAGLDLATVHGFLVETADAGLRFAHDVIRETLLSGLPPLRRRRVHSRAAAALEATAGDPAAIAFHAIAAGPSESARAAQFAHAAGVSARRRLAFDDAADWFRKAVQLAREQPDPDWAAVVSLQLALVRAQLDGGDWIAAQRTRADAIRTADLTDDPEPPLRALVALDAPSVWTLRSFADVDLDLVGRVERALAVVPESDSGLRCRLLSALAAELSDGSGHPRCDALSAEAVGMARRLDDPRLLASALHHRYQALNRPRCAPELANIAQELIDLGAAEGLPAYELLGHELSAMCRMTLFDVRGADEETAAAEPLLRRLSWPAATTIHGMWQALRLLADGRLNEAEDAYEHSLADLRRLGFFGTEVLTEVVRALLNTIAGQWDAVAGQADRLSGTAPNLALSLKAWALAESGRRVEAHALLDAQSPAVLEDWSDVTLLAVASQAAVAAGHEARMHWCYEQLLPYSGWFAVGSNSLVLGPVDYYLARLAGALGDADASAEHRSRAESDSRDAGLFWWAEKVASLAGSSTPSRPQAVR